MINPLYTLKGVVISGQQRGKKLGFPTANVSLNQTIPEGIYAATITIGRHTYQSATFIGSAKTFSEQDLKAESYILDFNEDIYGRDVVIRLYKKIRENQKFITVDALIKQMNDDVVKTKDYFQSTH